MNTRMRARMHTHVHRCVRALAHMHARTYPPHTCTHAHSRTHTTARHGMDSSMPHTHAHTPARARTPQVGAKGTTIEQQLMAMRRLMSLPTVIFVVGSFAVGKTKLCEVMVRHFAVEHINLEALIYAEVEQGSTAGQHISRLQSAGSAVPREIVIGLVRKAIRSKKAVLIDGIVRSVDEAWEFERSVAPCSAVLHVTCTTETAMARAKARDRNLTDIEFGVQSREADELTAAIVAQYRAIGKQAVVGHIGDGADSISTEHSLDHAADSAHVLLEGLGIKLDALALVKKVVYMMGAPGAGKARVCSQLAADFGFGLISLPALLHAQVRRRCLKQNCRRAVAFGGISYVCLVDVRLSESVGATQSLASP